MPRNYEALQTTPAFSTRQMPISQTNSLPFSCKTSSPEKSKFPTSSVEDNNTEQNACNKQVTFTDERETQSSFPYGRFQEDDTWEEIRLRSAASSSDPAVPTRKTKNSSLKNTRGSLEIIRESGKLNKKRSNGRKNSRKSESDSDDVQDVPYARLRRALELPKWLKTPFAIRKKLPTSEPDGGTEMASGETRLEKPSLISRLLPCLCKK